MPLHTPCPPLVTLSPSLHLVELQVESGGHQGKLSQDVARHVHFVLGNHQSPLHVLERVSLAHQLGNLAVHTLTGGVQPMVFPDVWGRVPRKWLWRAGGCLQTVCREKQKGGRRSSLQGVNLKANVLKNDWKAINLNLHG